MSKKKWVSAEIVDLTIQKTESSPVTSPTHDGVIIGQINGFDIEGHS